MSQFKRCVQDARLAEETIILNAPACTAGGVLVFAGGKSLTGVRQTLQTAAFWALSSAAFSLATPSLS